MISIEVLENPIQYYSWGSFTYIADLLGQKVPADKPQAELWMGAHPSAPSVLLHNNEKISLIELIHKYPDAILGKTVYRKFGPSLPFLFKILAAERPLSIQVHPNLKQAKKGFKKENKQKIPMDSKKRNYKDANHKPECICALTDFWALIGFRKISSIINYMEQLSDGYFEKEISQLKRADNPKGLKRFFYGLMTMDSERKKQLVHTVVENAEKNINEGDMFKWILHLNKEYEKDIGILAPILLNLVCIRPGEAVFLQPGEFHSYLKGVCIELMANSDNVIRGGLTPKNVDIPELLNILNFKEKEVNVLTPEQHNSLERRFLCPVKEFVLSTIHVQHQKNYSSSKQRAVEILICTGGNAEIKENDTGKKINIKKGVSVLIPASANAYQINGDAVLYKATVPL